MHQPSPQAIADQIHKTAIAELIYTYAAYIRRGRGVECAALFSAEGVFEIRDKPLDGDGNATVRAVLKGPEALHRYLVHGDASDTRICPVIHNPVIRIDGNRAVAESVMTATLWPRGKRIVGEYEDHLLFDGRWKFQRRRFDILGEFAS